MSWIRVSRDRPCPICQKPDWCSVSENGSVACCMRVESEKEVKGDSGGWIHTINPDLVTRVRNVFRRAKPKPSAQYPSDHWHKIQASFDMQWSFAGRAEQLGISRESLRRLMAGLHDKALAFPMWDGRGKMIGIRLKAYNGQRCVRGSQNGIFWPIGVSSTGTGLLCIAEGPTDTAALLDLGFDAIGRPNCCSGTDHIKRFLKVKRPVVIVADGDKPGIDGAKRLAQKIKKQCLSVKVIVPLAKDMRAWYNQGATRKDVERLIHGTKANEKNARSTA